MPMRRYISKLFKIRGVTLGVELLLIGLVYFGVKWYTQQELVTEIPGNMTFQLIDGNTVSLDHYRGRPLLLHFWASWCPVCDLEKNSINAISKDYPVLSIAMNSGTATDIRTYLQQHQLDFPSVADVDGNIARQFGVHGVPVSFIIGTMGQVAFVEKGYTTEYGLRLRLWYASQ